MPHKLPDLPYGHGDLEPHIDQDLAREVFDRTWLGEQLSRRPR
jgi:hypothetical protein